MLKRNTNFDFPFTQQQQKTKQNQTNQNKIKLECNSLDSKSVKNNYIDNRIPTKY